MQGAGECGRTVGQQLRALWVESGILSPGQSSSHPTQSSRGGWGGADKIPTGKRAGLVFEVLVNSPKVDLAVKHRSFL